MTNGFAGNVQFEVNYVNKNGPQNNVIQTASELSLNQNFVTSTNPFFSNANLYNRKDIKLDDVENRYKFHTDQFFVSTPSTDGPCGNPNNGSGPCNFTHMFWPVDFDSHYESNGLFGIRSLGRESQFCANSSCTRLKVPNVTEGQLDKSIVDYKQELIEKYKNLKFKNWIDKQKRIYNRLAFYYESKFKNSMSATAKDDLDNLAQSCILDNEDINNYAQSLANQISSSIEKIKHKQMVKDVAKNQCDYITNIINGSNKDRKKEYKKIKGKSFNFFNSITIWNKKKREKVKNNIQEEITNIFSDLSADYNQSALTTLSEDLDNKTSNYKFCQEFMLSIKLSAGEENTRDPKVALEYFTRNSFLKPNDTLKDKFASLVKNGSKESEYLEAALNHEKNEIEKECAQLQGDDLKTIFCADTNEIDFSELSLLVDLDPDLAGCFKNEQLLITQPKCAYLGKMTCSKGSFYSRISSIVGSKDKNISIADQNIASNLLKTRKNEISLFSDENQKKLVEISDDVGKCNNIVSDYRKSSNSYCKKLVEGDFDFSSYAIVRRNCFASMIYDDKNMKLFSQNASKYLQLRRANTALAGQSGQEAPIAKLDEVIKELENNDDKPGADNGDPEEDVNNRGFIVMPGGGGDGPAPKIVGDIQTSVNDGTNLDPSASFLDKFSNKNSSLLSSTTQTTIDGNKIQIQSEENKIQELKKQALTPESQKEIENRQRKIDRLKDETSALEEKLADLKTKKDKDSYQALLDEIRSLKQQNEDLNKRVTNVVNNQNNSNVSSPIQTSNTIPLNGNNSPSFVSGNSGVLNSSNQTIIPTPTSTKIPLNTNHGGVISSDGNGLKTSKDASQINRVDGSNIASGFRLISEGETVSANVPVVPSVSMSTISSIKNGKLNQDILNEILKACEASLNDKKQCESSQEVVLVYKVNDKEEKMLVNLAKIKNKKERNVANDKNKEDDKKKKDRKQKYFVEDLNNLFGNGSK